MLTLFRNNKIAEFPDAITSRGTKHLNDLIAKLKKRISKLYFVFNTKKIVILLKLLKILIKSIKIAFKKALKMEFKYFVMIVN